MPGKIKKIYKILPYLIIFILVYIIGLFDHNLYYLGLVVQGSTFRVENPGQFVSKESCLNLVINPFHPMGYDGYARF